jgi:c-di-GMP-binding flagellar brake protein YcgR
MSSAAALRAANGASRPPSVARQHERAPVSWKARLEVAGGAYLEARAVDLSEGGVGVVAPDALGDVGEVEVWLAVPCDEQHRTRMALRLRARVAFQVYAGGQCRIGLQFLNIEATARQLLRNWVQRQRL